MFNAYFIAIIVKATKDKYIYLFIEQKYEIWLFKYLRIKIFWTKKFFLKSVNNNFWRKGKQTWLGFLISFDLSETDIEFMIFILNGVYDFTSQLQVLNRNHFTAIDLCTSSLLVETLGHSKFWQQITHEFLFLISVSPGQIQLVEMFGNFYSFV